MKFPVFSQLAGNSLSRDEFARDSLLQRRVTNEPSRFGHIACGDSALEEARFESLPPVRLDRVARPIPSSYSGNAKMPIVFAPKLCSERRKLPVLGEHAKAGRPSPCVRCGGSYWTDPTRARGRPARGSLSPPRRRAQTSGAAQSGAFQDAAVGHLRRRVTEDGDGHGTRSSYFVRADWHLAAIADSVASLRTLAQRSVGYGAIWRPRMERSGHNPRCRLRPMPARLRRHSTAAT